MTTHIVSRWFRRALDEVLASAVRALGREATRGLNEFFVGRIFQLSTRLRNQVQNDAGP
jgi:hypothetical protein